MADIQNNITSNVTEAKSQAIGLMGNLKSEATQLANAAKEQAQAAVDAAKAQAKEAADKIKGLAGAAKAQADAAKKEAADKAAKAKEAADKLKGMMKKPSLPSVPEYPNPPKLPLKEAPTPKKYVKAKTATLETSNAGSITIQPADIKAAKAAGSLTPEKQAAIDAGKNQTGRFLKKQKDGTSRWIYRYADSPLGWIYGDGTNVSKED